MHLALNLPPGGRAFERAATVLLESLLLLYSITFGFVAAGVVASFYQLVTAKPAAFRLPGRSWSELVLSGFFFALAGPILVFRLVAPRGGAAQPVSRMLAGLTICAIWSCSLGLLLIDARVRLL